MANDQGVRYGAFPVTAPQSPPVLLYFKAETGATLDIFRGQFVSINSRGNAQVIAPGDNIAAAGIAWGFLDANQAGLPSGITSLSQGAFLLRNTDAMIGVIVDPQQLYVMEEITGGTALAAVSIGQLVNWTYIATTGNTNTGYANTVIQNSSVGTGTGPLLQLLAVQNIINQDGTINASGASCKWIVRIANHQFNGTKLSVAQG